MSPMELDWQFPAHQTVQHTAGVHILVRNWIMSSTGLQKGYEDWRSSRTVNASAELYVGGLGGEGGGGGGGVLETQERP